MPCPAAPALLPLALPPPGLSQPGCRCWPCPVRGAGCFTLFPARALATAVHAAELLLAARRPRRRHGMAPARRGVLAAAMGPLGRRGGAEYIGDGDEASGPPGAVSRVPPRARLFKTGILPTISFGTETQGITPRELLPIRRAAAGGLPRAGCGAQLRLAGRGGVLAAAGPEARGAVRCWGGRSTASPRARALRCGATPGASGCPA
ncbi:unnamed protein product [Prorocentrum cordatum]|uniref:Uncharacterized protein n=1 Tax=Prorocentrum cordatum TaxID=2364126 RepID=A0ABN9QP90_9DINO|nr:unnamed protein product [Polarella glacialis]